MRDGGGPRPLWARTLLHKYLEIFKKAGWASWGEQVSKKQSSALVTDWLPSVMDCISMRKANKPFPPQGVLGTLLLKQQTGNYDPEKSYLSTMPHRDTPGNTCHVLKVVMIIVIKKKQLTDVYGRPVTTSAHQLPWLEVKNAGLELPLGRGGRRKPGNVLVDFQKE